MLKTLFPRVFGRFSWVAPPWLMRLRTTAAARPYTVLGSLIALIFLVFLSIYAIQWYQHRPRPLLVTAYITTPKITPAAKELVPDALTIDFGVNKGGFIPKSAAPLNLIGKEITTGIKIDPAIPGKWTWTNDNRLVFLPELDWLPGQQYKIHFDKKVFASTTKMEKLDYSFLTIPFEASIAQFQFYQDPVNPQIRQAVATIDFNYPVDADSFEQHASLTMAGNQFKFTVKYDENKRIAYLTSEPLPLPEKNQSLVLALTRGIKSGTGNDKTSDTIKKDVQVPNAASYFKVANLTAAIVRNPEDRPEQILTLETTIGAAAAEINKAFHVYLLPVKKLNEAWQNPGEVTPDILKLSETVNLQALPVERDFAVLHSYRFNAPASRYLYIKLDKGIKSFGNYQLGENYAAVLKVPAYPQEIRFLHSGSLLALNNEKKLSVLVRGIPAVKFQIARVLPDDVNHLVTQTSGNFNNPYFVNEYLFNQNNISEIFSEVQLFDAAHPEQQQYTALNIGKYLAAKNNPNGPQGLFLLQALSWDKENNQVLDDNVKTARLILLTDLGLVVKDNNDGSHDVFVSSITQGGPAANTEITVLGKNGLPILSRTTDAAGHALVPSLNDFIDERTPVAYLAKKASDISFMPVNNFDRELNYSRYDVGGVYSSHEIQTLTAYLFSDRGIYRPGDSVHIGMIVKQAYAGQQPAGLPLQVSVTDPRGTTVKEQRMTLDASGFMTLDFQTNAAAPTGQYSISLYIVKDKHPSSLLGSTNIRVAEFQPDRMRITSALSSTAEKGWVSPNQLTHIIHLWNLYGAPAADRKVSAKIVLAPKTVKFAEYPNYVFFDPLFDPKKPAKIFSDTLTDTTTDNNGQAQFDLNLDRFDKATYQLTVYSEGFEAEGGRSVTAQTTALVSPLEYLVGYKTDGDLNYIKQNSQRSVHFIAVNPQLKLQTLKNLTVELALLRPVSTLVKNPDGTFQYRSIMQTQIISTQPLMVGEQGTDYSLPTQQIGDFLLTIYDEHHIELSKLKFTVAGASQTVLAKNAELSVKLNKEKYLPGEEIEIQMTAPYTGAGLITIERDKVYASQWFVSTTTTSVQKIRLPKDFQGNGYINVAFVRDWNSPEIFVSPLSYAVVPFSVNHDASAVQISLTTAPLARPGEPFVIQYKTDKPAKIIIFAVDEGILQAANYKVPDPLGFFFQKRALEVVTRQTVDQILPKFMQDRELSAVGGDGGEQALKSHLNPFKRKTELPVVFWSGIVDADTTVRQVTYQVPNYFNGTLHVMAVAAAANAVGAVDKSSEIRGHFVINPNVPTFVAPGDEFTITASIANNVKGPGKITVKLNASPQLEILTPITQELSVSEGREQTVRYRVRAKNNLGSADLNFSAHLGNKSSEMPVSLSIRPASAFFTTVISGSSDKAVKTEKLDRVLYPEFRDVQAAMSTSPLILVAGLQRYLDNFPFGCTEQLISKAFPLVAANSPHREKIIATIQMLGQRQMSSGGFSYWPNMGENRNNDFASVYAMHFLTEAKAQGYDVASDVFNGGIGYLKELAQQDTKDLEHARLQAYAIYLLTRNEWVTTNYLTHLQIYLDQDPKKLWRNDILSTYLAAVYQLLKSYEEADRLINYYHLHAQSAEEDAQYLFLLARHFPDLLAKKGSEIVMSLAADMNNDSINTIFSSYASLALSAYGQSYETARPAQLSIDKIMADNQVVKIQFNNPGKQLYFYQITQAGFDKKLPGSVTKNNIEVDREYRDSKGNVITQVPLGSEIEVHVQARALNDRFVNNVAIIDLLPGGFEVVSGSVKGDNIDYADVREDRVVFFLGLSSSATEIVYRIKATNIGKFTVPPVYGVSMYDPGVNAHGVAGAIEVGPP